MQGIELYLVRHAIAAERGDAWPDDTLRPLTARGLERFTRAVRGLRLLGVSLDEIFTSPLVRARQTADLLAANLAGPPAVRVLDALAPGHAASAVLSEAARIARGRRVALVGHEPDLGQLAACVLGTTRAPLFRKGSVCRIDMSSLTGRRPGTLVWFLPPRALRRLGDR